MLFKKDHNIPNNIFILWLQGWTNAPPLQKKALESWKKHNPTWNIILLDKENINKYVDIDFVKNKKITPQALSDIIRINVLNTFGGIWADATLFCLKPVDSWITEYTKSEDFFMYHGRGGGMPKECGPCSWFLVSSKNNYLIKRWETEVNSFWNENDSTDNYFWMDALFKKLYKTDLEFKIKWNNVKYIYTNDFGKSHTLSIHKPETINKELQQMIKNDPPEVIKLWNYFNSYLNRPNIQETNGGFIYNFND